MPDAIKTQEINGHTVKVFYDTGACESPREYETSTFFGFHRSYVSPDAAPSTDPLESQKIALHRDNIALPVWLYAHGGTCYKAAESNPFHCPWDSGQFGYIYISRADARARYDAKRITKALEARILESLKAEVDAYSQWVNGEVYGFTVEDADGEQVESCWGFVGDSDYCLAQGIEAAQSF